MFNIKENCNEKFETEYKHTEMKNEQITNLKDMCFRIDYGNFVYENRYINENTLIWKSVKGKSMTGLDEGQEVTESVIAIATQPNKFLVSWVEKSGLGVTQFLDFEKEIIHSIIRDGNNLTTERGTLTIVDQLK